MLQQTQVNTVIPYFDRFISAFPTLESLASSDIEAVLHHWTGLGYYSRARNLHKTATIIQRDYGGLFPNDMNDLLTLPGIGRSTAGAILSLASHQHHPILDGNVKRILCRYFMVEGWSGTTPVINQLWHYAEDITPVTVDQPVKRFELSTFYWYPQANEITFGVPAPIKKLLILCSDSFT